MDRNYELTPTLLGYSETEVGVIAGGGVFGFGGVVLHEPTRREFHRVVHDLEYESSDPKGISFNYGDVATITVSGLLKWTNFNLERAPEGRQDVKEAGPVRIEVFDDIDTRQYLEEKASLLDRLGIKFIG